MALNNIFEVRAHWINDNGQLADMIRYYQCFDQGTGDGDAGDLVVQIGQEIDSVINQKMNEVWTGLNVECQNLSNIADYASRGMMTQPSVIGSAMPSFVAVGFRSPKQAFGYNRSRVNLPVGTSGYLTTGGQLDESGLEAYEPIAALLGAVISSTGPAEKWNPVTVKKAYVDGIFAGATVRAVVSGLWQIDKEFTTVKSRQAYVWTDID